MYIKRHDLNENFPSRLTMLSLQGIIVHLVKTSTQGMRSPPLELLVMGLSKRLPNIASYCYCPSLLPPEEEGKSLFLKTS